jgi:hypothetical protein
MYSLAVKVVHLDDHTDELLWPHLLECAEFIECGRLRAYGHDADTCFGDAAPARGAGAHGPSGTLPAEPRTAAGLRTPLTQPPRGGVLVHCTLGISRSASIVTAYMMLAGRLRLAEALSHLRTARRWVRPNDGFEAQLRHLEHLLFSIPPTVIAPPPLAAGPAQAALPARRPTGAYPGDALLAARTSGVPQRCGCSGQWPSALGELERGTASYVPAAAACELCALARTTPWHLTTHPAFVVLDCDSCDTPMVALRRHGVPFQALAPALARESLRALAAVADARYGAAGWYYDGLQRSVCLHSHVHARPGRASGSQLGHAQSAGVGAVGDGGRATTARLTGSAGVGAEAARRVDSGAAFAHPALDPLQSAMAAVLTAAAGEHGEVGMAGREAAFWAPALPAGAKTASGSAPRAKM